MNTTTDLYNHLDRLSNPVTSWRNENITIRSLDKLININLDKFFSASDEYGKKEKLEILINFRERINREYRYHFGGHVLALAVSGIAHEVFKEGQHTLHKPAEVSDQIAYHILSQNLVSLDEIFLKDNEDILITEKFKENLDSATLRLLDEDEISLQYYGLENAAEAVDFVIDHQSQLSIANLSFYTNLDSLLLEKLRVSCPNLQRLDLTFCEIQDISKLAEVLGKMTTLKYLNFSNNSHLPKENLISVLKKLTSLKHLNLDNSQLVNNDNTLISLRDLCIVVEQMIDLETLVIPRYWKHKEDEINQLVQVLSKLSSLQYVFTTDRILQEKFKEKLKTNVKVEEYQPAL